MIGGGIFTVLGISVALVGVLTPLVIILVVWSQLLLPILVSNWAFVLKTKVPPTPFIKKHFQALLLGDTMVQALTNSG